MLKEFYNIFIYLYYFCKNRIFIMVVLSTLVAILDSFGIIMLFPILSMILDSQSIVNTNIEWLNDFFDYLNVLGFNQFQIFIFMLTVFFLKSL